jgi:hypothetical protein
LETRLPGRELKRQASLVANNTGWWVIHSILEVHVHHIQDLARGHNDAVD